MIIFGVFLPFQAPPSPGPTTASRFTSSTLPRTPWWRCRTRNTKPGGPYNVTSISHQLLEIIQLHKNQGWSFEKCGFCVTSKVARSQNAQFYRVWPPSTTRVVTNAPNCITSRSCPPSTFPTTFLWYFSIRFGIRTRSNGEPASYDSWGWGTGRQTWQFLRRILDTFFADHLSPWETGVRQPRPNWASQESKLGMEQMVSIFT